MWTYKKQITIRWVSFALSIAIVAALIYAFKCDGSYLTAKEISKTAIANFSAYVSSLPFWVPFVFFGITVLFMSLGVPTIIFFGILLVAYNVYVAFAVTYAAQIVSTCICMRLSYFLFKAEDFSGELYNRAEALKENCVSFSFWSRVYFTFPLRTIDNFLPIIHSEKETLNKDLIASACAILIRMLIPSLWLNSVYNSVMIVDFTPDIEKKLLFWSSALIVYAIVPRAPELIICPEIFKDLLFKITPYTVAPTPAKNISKNSRTSLDNQIASPTDNQENDLNGTQLPQAT